MINKDNKKVLKSMMDKNTPEQNKAFLNNTIFAEEVGYYDAIEDFENFINNYPLRIFFSKKRLRRELKAMKYLYKIEREARIIK